MRPFLIVLLLAAVSMAAAPWRAREYWTGMQFSEGRMRVDTSIIATKAYVGTAGTATLMNPKFVQGSEPYMEITYGDSTYRIVLTAAGADTNCLDLTGTVVQGTEPYWQISYCDTLYRIVLTKVP